MGRLFASLSAVSAPARMRAHSDPLNDPRYWTGTGADSWFSLLSASGVQVTPELALTLTAMYSGVTMIGTDMATLPAQTFQTQGEDGKTRVRPFFGDGIDTSNGIRSLAYMLRWQPNPIQTATEFWLAMIAQYLLREMAYAEIITHNARVVALVPRHPDRVTPEILPSGRMRFKMAERSGPPRYLSHEEMFAVRGLSFDLGLTGVSRVRYGAHAIGTALAARDAQAKFFKSGMTAAKIATYNGVMSPEDEQALHASISRFASGVENSFGLALVPDKVTITNLGVEPEKAQMMLAQEWGVREIARLLRMPGSKLGIEDSKSYANQVQEALDYVITCLRPIAFTVEQAIQRDLILRKDSFFVEFKLEALLRGDFETQANYLEKFIRARIMRPSEARVILNMNPDAELDELSKRDFQPGQAGSRAPQPATPREERSARESRASLKSMFAVQKNAERCLRREKHRVGQLATKHASDVEGWQAGLRDFYADQAQFIAQTMRLPLDIARGYAAQHGSAVQARGVGVFDGEDGERWIESEADELCLLALYGSDAQEAA